MVNSVLRKIFGREMEEEVIMRNKTNKCTYIQIYIYLFYYKQRSLLYVSATYCGQNIEEATLFVLQQIYISVYVLVGFISLIESSVHGHESFKN